MRGRRALLLAALLAVATLAAFAPVLGNGFIAEYDDEDYILKNARVRAGLSAEGVSWAFRSVGYAANWHPLTWLSHMLDVQLFGLDPRGHHLVSALIHAANCVLLFLVLRALTGRELASALVAALFGLHPLHVQSVAWAAERKDVLSTLLLLAALGAWLRHLRRPQALRYGAALGLYCLGLLAKPMLVSLPLLLLVLDVWPLGRLRPRSRGSLRALLLEKAPLLLPAAGSAAVTLVAQQHVGAVTTLEQLPLPVRAGNAAVAILSYVGKAVWPAGLSVLYPHPGTGLAVWLSLGAAFAVAGVTVAAAALARRAPWLLGGWLWYLVTLAPVLGIVQVGAQAFADRYTYIPLVGLFVAAVWSAAETVRGGGAPAGSRVVGTLLLLAALALATARETRFWKDGLTLFSRAVAVTEGNPMARVNLGNALVRGGRKEEAAIQYAEAVRLTPRYPEAHANLGRVLAETGRLAEASFHLRRYLDLSPGAKDRAFVLSLIRLVESRLGGQPGGAPR